MNSFRRKTCVSIHLSTLAYIMAEGNQRKIAQFLKHHLDAGTFPFLEWLDRERGVARVAWTHGSRIEGPLCRRWHVERNGVEPPDDMKPPKLKHNFDMAVKNGRGVHYLKDAAKDMEEDKESREYVLSKLGVSLEKNKKYFVIEADVFLNSDSDTSSRSSTRQSGSSRVPTPRHVTSAPTSVQAVVSPESGFGSIPATVEELTPENTQDFNPSDNMADARSDITADTARSRSPLTCTAGATGATTSAVPKRKTSTGSRQNSKKSPDNAAGTSTPKLPIPGLQNQVPGQFTPSPRNVQSSARTQQLAGTVQAHSCRPIQKSFPQPSPGNIAVTSDILANALREVNIGPDWANSPQQVMHVVTAQPTWNVSGESEQRQKEPQAPINFRNEYRAVNWVKDLTPRGIPEPSHAPPDLAPPDLTNYVPTMSISSSGDRELKALAGVEQRSCDSAQRVGAVAADSAMDVKPKSSKSVSDAEMKSISDDIEKMSLVNPVSVTSSEARDALEMMVDNTYLLEQLQSKPLHQCELPEPINDQGKEIVVVVRLEEQIIFAQIVVEKCRVVAFPDTVRPKRGIRPIPLWPGSDEGLFKLKSQTRDLLQFCRSGIVLECSGSGQITARAEIGFPLSKAYSAFRPPLELQPRDAITIFNPDYWSLQRHPYVSLESPEVWIYVGNNPDVRVGVVTRKAHGEYRRTVMQQR